MIGYVIGVTVAVIWCGAVVFLAIYAADEGSALAGIGAAIIFILGMAFILNAMAEEDSRGPCLKEETQWAYNAGTKTTMPYTVCVQRGEWVNP